MIESEAKTKWCPFANSRTVDRAMEGGRRVTTSWVPDLDDLDSFTLRCVGSSCMAWQQTDNECINAAQPESAAVVDYNYVPAGYCGLAGRSV